MKIRDCLKCSKHFKSIWAGNRICPRCNGDNVQVSVLGGKSRPIRLGKKVSKRI